jgi:hypothetical protein
LKYRRPDLKIKEKYTASYGACEEINTIVDGVTVPKVWLADCPSGIRYESVARTYYRAADALIFVFDLTSEKSLSSFTEWKAKVLEARAPGASL